MQSSFLLQLLQALGPQDLPRLRKFLQSPYFNHRSDVLILYEELLNYRKNGYEGLEKGALFSCVWPGEPYDNRRINHLFSQLTALVERYFALEEIMDDAPLLRLRHCRALRKRNVGQQFERDIELLERDHRAGRYRNAAFYLYSYELENERFAWEALHSRGAHARVPAAAGALADFFMLENLRWACTAQSAKALSAAGGRYAVPMSEEVLAASDAIPETDKPALALLRRSLLALRDNTNEETFRKLQEILPRHIHLLPPAEARDVYMSAINFAIRRHNSGERDYTRAAFDLYRAALAKNILTENGLLPKYTFLNIFNLAQLAGASGWALEFLERDLHLLPEDDRLFTHRYCLATYHFRQGHYPEVLDLLRAVEFGEVFINLDVRKMLLRSYFELGEWPALASLLTSFRIYLKRQHDIGYHREGYLNLIRFTKKLARSEHLTRARRKTLAEQIREAKFVSEREWLLEKAAG